jgi:hypothetical protein
LLFAVFLAACLAGTGGAFAVEINVLSAGAVQEAEKAIAGREATGAVNFTVGTVGQIQDKLKSGALADVIVVSTTAPDSSKSGESAQAAPYWATASRRVKAARRPTARQRVQRSHVEGSR